MESSCLAEASAAATCRPWRVCSAFFFEALANLSNLLLRSEISPRSIKHADLCEHDLLGGPFKDRVNNNITSLTNFDGSAKID